MKPNSGDRRKPVAAHIGARHARAIKRSKFPKYPSSKIQFPLLRHCTPHFGAIFHCARRIIFAVPTRKRKP
ncbi:hypothetical protein [Burkholderia multivorans]|uniref:hypothetical protein n=1 Tax=Burkholderia multivorans TaxID=87883 RepID=UPI0019CFA95F|nr:hypothetical protein [Burkholderia multivorans]MBN6730875.1 hypothetical protein [Burkholderia multivorans]MBN6733852.1 hypothetical protein [Burkholderia multivorans]MBN7130131.1 hypothetical protein [Burkholderia multivorans]MBN8166764.1 hypothetical protein [Burkholderia multivorans]MBN8172558.1 hypothetical protein [Burkholderia multivorans]